MRGLSKMMLQIDKNMRGPGYLLPIEANLQFGDLCWSGNISLGLKTRVQTYLWEAKAIILPTTSSQYMASQYSQKLFAKMLVYVYKFQFHICAYIYTYTNIYVDIQLVVTHRACLIAGQQSERLKNTEARKIFILLQVVDQFSQHQLLKRLSFFHCIFLPPLSKIRCPQVRGFILWAFCLCASTILS